MEFVLFNKRNKCYLADDETKSQTKNLQNAMIVIGEDLVNLVIKDVPHYKAIKVIRPNKNNPSYIELS